MQKWGVIADYSIRVIIEIVPTDINEIVFSRSVSENIVFSNSQ